jgi:hypothetical protein
MRTMLEHPLWKWRSREHARPNCSMENPPPEKNPGGPEWHPDGSHLKKVECEKELNKKINVFLNCLCCLRDQVPLKQC